MIYLTLSTLLAGAICYAAMLHSDREYAERQAAHWYEAYLRVLRGSKEEE